MGNLHEVIIDHVSKVISGEAVGLEQNLILQLLILYGDIAVNGIVERSDTLCRHLLTDDIGRARREQTVNFLLREAAAVAIVPAERIFLMQRSQTLLRTEAVICFSFLYKLLGILFISIHALALHIRPIRPADVGAFVVLQANRFQGVVNHLDSALHLTFLIGIFNPQDEIPALILRNQIFIQRCAQIAHMHKPGGTGSKSGSNFFLLHSNTPSGLSCFHS